MDGRFRFVLAPRVPDHLPCHPRTAGNSSAEANPPHPDQGAKQLQLRAGGTVQAAKNLVKVRPEYPEIARREHLQGTVRLRALIAKDGSVCNLVVLRGHCSLAKASIEAVSKWRYSPTLFNGQPVEVDTTIDVTFALNY